MSTQQKFCTFCLNAGKNKEECYGHFPGADCPTLANTQCTRCKENGHTRSKCEAEICRYCKKNGHRVENCLELKARNNKLVCRFCKKEGHKIDDCEELRAKNDANKNKYCSFCGERGHTQNRCPSPYLYQNRSKYH